MTKIATVITVELRGFNKKAQAEDACETARYLAQYIDFIGSCATSRQWRFVKAIGDGILIVAPQEATTEAVQQFFDEVTEEYQVALLYRTCEFVEHQVTVGSYACLDIFGKDICNLFLRDEKTTRLG